MQIEEFKAWFEGICENIESTPSAAQFTKIKAKIASLEAKPVAKLMRDAWAPVPSQRLPAYSDEHFTVT